MQEKGKPLISVIMPAYNSGKLIEESIQSVISQTYQNWELIVINDGSTDDTAEIVMSLGSLDKRIKLISQRNSGIGASRNSGYSNSLGEWVAYLDHDDLWSKDKLEKQIAVAHLNPSYDVLFSGGYFFYNNDLTNLTAYKTIYGEFDFRKMFLRQLEENYIPTLAVLVRRSVIEKVGPWDEDVNIQGCDDYDYWFRMAKIKAVFFSLEERLFFYRKHDSNFSNNSIKMLLAESNVLIKNFDKWILNDNDKVRLFKKKFHSIQLALFRNGETKNVELLLSKLYSILPSMMLKIALLALARSKSYLTLKIFLKMDRLTNL